MDKTRIGFLTLLGLPVLLVLPAFTPAGSTELLQCEMSFQPATVAAGAPAQEVTVTLNIAEGAELDPSQIRTLRTPEESGLKLAVVEGDAFLIAVDPSGALAGAWEIEAYAASAGDGESQDPLCVGTITVL